MAELQKEFINHNFKTHQWKEKKIALNSTAERFSKHVKDPGCFTDSAVSHVQYSSVFLECAPVPA